MAKKAARPERSIEERQKCLRAVYLAVGAVYLAMVVFATIYAQTAYIANLPAVSLTSVAPGSIDYTFEAGATLEDELVIARIDTTSAPFPSRVLTDKCKVTLRQGGTLADGKIINVHSDNAGIVVEIEPDSAAFDERSAILAEITCDTSIVFEATLPRSALGTDMNQQIFINAVEQAEGPWGMRSIISQKQTYVWPLEGSDRVLVLMADDGELLIAESVAADSVYAGMEVRVAD